MKNNGTWSHSTSVADATGCNNIRLMTGTLDTDGMPVGATISNSVGGGIDANSRDGWRSPRTRQGTTFTGIGGFTDKVRTAI